MENGEVAGSVSPVTRGDPAAPAGVGAHHRILGSEIRPMIDYQLSDTKCLTLSKLSLTDD